MNDFCGFSVSMEIIRPGFIEQFARCGLGTTMGVIVISLPDEATMAPLARI
jgi:hypothetical protein